MTCLPVMLPGADKPKWARPEHFLNVFQWLGLGSHVNVSTGVPPVINGRPAYVLNLNNQYRLDWELANKKAANNPCVYDALDIDLYNEVVRRDGMLVLDSSVEALMPRPDIAAGMFRGFERANIDPSRVAIIGCNLRAAPVFAERFFGSNASSPRIVDFDTCFWLIAGLNRETKQNSEALATRARRVETSRAASRPFKFVSFNGRLRPHRFYVVLWLLANGLLEQGQLSFLAYDAKARPTDQSQLRDLLIRSGYPDVLDVIPWFDRLVERLPITIDVSLEESQASAAYKRTLPWRSQPSEHYDSAWFSVVVDTDFLGDDCLFLTPIAFKSFMNFSPFVYFGNSGALKRMRELGFRTFSPWIDETYDSVLDPFERMRLALQEIRRLCLLSHEQLREMYNELWPTLAHNYWHIHRDAPARAQNGIENSLLKPIFD